MKNNWATGIVVAMLAFVLFIVYFLVKATTDVSYNHEFVTENYYEKELEYEKKNRQEDATRKKGMQVAISHESPQGVLFVFPSKANSPKGMVSFYRPNNQRLDFVQPIKVDENGHMRVPHEKLVEGRWDISVEYTTGEDTQLYVTTLKIEY